MKPLPAVGNAHGFRLPSTSIHWTVSLPTGVLRSHASATCTRLSVFPSIASCISTINDMPCNLPAWPPDIAPVHQIDTVFLRSSRIPRIPRHTAKHSCEFVPRPSETHSRCGSGSNAFEISPCVNHPTQDLGPAGPALRTSSNQAKS